MELNQALQAGDVISVAVLTNGANTTSGNDRGIFITTATSRPSTATCTLTGTSSTGKEYASATYTVATDDGICGETTLYIWRETGNTTYFKDLVITRPDPATAPTITTQPASATYMVDDTPAALTVAATASSGDLSYQWYKNTDQDKTAKEDDKISGATSATLAAENISTASVGTTYYYVVIKDGQGTTTSDLATISVVSGVAPEVSAKISASLVRNGVKVTLTATVSAGLPEPTLQWYTCDSDGSNEAAIEGATSETYAYTPTAVGTFSFKVKAHNDSGDAYSDVQTLKVVEQGTAGTVDNLVTITSNYTFIADNITENGTAGLTSGYLYDEGRVFSPNGNSVATNKGKSTIDGTQYYNSLRVKSSGQDVLVFKVGGACTITFYAQTTGNTGDKARPIKVGNAVDANTYGTITDVDESHVVEISAASTVYLTGTGDRFIAGYKITFPSVDLTEDATDYTPVAATGVTVNLTRTLSSSYYNSICLPFDVDLTDTEGPLYGADVQEFSSVDGTVLKFSAVEASDGMKAGTPYLVKPTANVENPTFEGVDVQAIAAQKVAKTNASSQEFGFQGTYTTVTLATDKTNQFLNTSGQFAYPATEATATMKGLRAYFVIPAAIFGGGSAPELGIDFGTGNGGGTTNIDGMEYKTAANGVYYNLNGQRVGQPTKGLYIVNGKKYIVK